MYVNDPETISFVPAYFRPVRTHAMHKKGANCANDVCMNSAYNTVTLKQKNTMYIYVEQNIPENV